MRFYFPIRDIAPEETVELVREHNLFRAEGLWLSPSVPADQLAITSVAVEPTAQVDKLVFRLMVRSFSDKPVRFKAFMYDRNDPIAMALRFQDRAEALVDETDPADVRARETYVEQSRLAFERARQLDESYNEPASDMDA